VVAAAIFVLTALNRKILSPSDPLTNDIANVMVALDKKMMENVEYVGSVSNVSSGKP
jgi:hypothetical protein